MIFAAGLGTRMGDLTADRPKPMINIAGKPLIDHALSLVNDADIGKAVVNLHYLPDALTRHLQGQNILFSDETDRLLETGGGFKKAADMLGSDAVFTMNSDAIWKGQNPLKIVAETWNAERMDALLLLVPQDRAHGHEAQHDFDLTDHGHVKRPGPFRYTGVQIIKPQRVTEVQDDVFSLNLVWNRLIAKGKLYGCIYEGHWCDVGNPSGIHIAESLLASDV